METVSKVVGLLATNVHPLAGLAATAVLGLVGTYTLAAQRSTEPAVQRHDRSAVGEGVGHLVGDLQEAHGRPLCPTSPTVPE